MFRSLVLATLINVAASISFAGARENFGLCKAHDPSWMSRFGNYVVAFNRNSAYDICRKKAWPSLRGVNVRQTGCYINRTWHLAGYYCESV